MRREIYKWFDGVVRKFGYERRKSIAKRGFHAAAVNRLTGDWPTNLIAPDSILRMELKALRARCRELARNNDYFVKFLQMLKANVIGSEGIALKVKALDPPRLQAGKVVQSADLMANKLIEDAWWEWSRPENCTVHRNLSWYDVQNLMIETLAKEGECLIEKVYGAEAGNPFGFALRLLDNDLLDTDKNEDIRGGGRIIMGVQKDAFGAVTAYHLYTANPSETTYPYPSRTTVAVPAKKIVHLFLPRDIGQSRGYPWGAVSLLRLQMLGGYEEAELVAARTAASKMAFLKKIPGLGDPSYPGAPDGAGNKYMEAEPGHIEELPMGMDVSVVDWNHPSQAYPHFVSACLRGIASGLGVSYPTLANDYASVNFSAGRMSQMEERELWMCLQRFVATHAHTPIFSDWLDMSLMGGAIGLPYEKFPKFNYPTWHGRRWTWVDPLKEVEAKIREINAGFTSHTRVLAEMGIDDEDELLDEIAAFQEKVKARGIILPEVFQEEKQESDTVENETEMPERGAKVTVPQIVMQPKINVEIPEIKVPETRVDVHIPEIKVPEIKVPDIILPQPPEPKPKKVRFQRDAKGVIQSAELEDMRNGER